MARVDAEAALDELAGWVADTKTGYGREELLRKIAQLRARHRISETILERALRLYGGHVIVSAPPTEDVPAAAGEAELDGDKVTDLGHATTAGGHDGRAGTRASLAGAGRP